MDSTSSSAISQQNHIYLQANPILHSLSSPAKDEIQKHGNSTSETGFSCPKCSTTLKTLKTLNRHILSTCPFKQKPSMSTVTTNIVVQKTSEGNYLCKGCGKTLESLDSVYTHLQMFCPATTNPSLDSISSPVNLQQDSVTAEPTLPKMDPTSSSEISQHNSITSELTSPGTTIPPLDFISPEIPQQDSLNFPTILQPNLLHPTGFPQQNGLIFTTSSPQYSVFSPPVPQHGRLIAPAIHAPNSSVIHVILSPIPQFPISCPKKTELLTKIPNKRFTCPHCGTSTSNKYLLAAHLQLKCPMRQYPPFITEFVFQKNRNGKYSCTGCGKKYKSRASENIHLRMSCSATKNQRSQPRPANDSTVDIGPDLIHPSTSTSGIYPLAQDATGQLNPMADKVVDYTLARGILCTQGCGKLLTCNGEMLKHNNVCEALKRPPLEQGPIQLLYCTKCPEAFDSFIRKIKHEKSHGDKHLCTKCTTGFNILSSLVKHKFRIHQISSCSICDLDFETPEAFEIHKEQVHIANEIEMYSPIQPRTSNSTRTADIVPEISPTPSFSGQNPGESESTKLYPCDTCGLTFISEWGLRHHKLKKRCTSLLPGCVKCDKCGKFFTSEQTLKLHTRTFHSSVKRPSVSKMSNQETKEVNAFKCSVCNKGFALKDSLKRHRKNFHSPQKVTTHLKAELKQVPGESSPISNTPETKNRKVKLMKCNVCSKGFITNHDLIKHQRSIHPSGKINESWRFQDETSGLISPFINETASSPLVDVQLPELNQDSDQLSSTHIKPDDDTTFPNKPKLNSFELKSNLSKSAESEISIKYEVY